jgi:two-component sensor histidine kinase
MTRAFVHEIKNPASVALAHVNIMRLFACAEHAPHLDAVERALHEVCGISQRHSLLTSGETCARLVVDEILSTYVQAWPGIAFTVDAAENVPVQGSHDAVRMIVSNLLKNAVEAVDGQHGAAIHICIREARSRVHIHITDSGGTPKKKPYASGMGLQIANDIAAEIGGEVVQGAATLLPVYS